MKKKVLIIEDDEEALKDYFSFFKEYYDVDATGNPQEGLEKVKHSLDINKPYFAVIIDYLMPVMDGRKLFNLIRKMDKNIKAVILTNNIVEETYNAFSDNKPDRIFFKDSYETDKILKYLKEEEMKC